MTPSAHDVLEVPVTATHDEIRRAYRRLAKRWHPDHCPHDPSATRQLQAVNAAYEALAACRPPTPAPETLLWRASRDGETIVLTTTRLRHEQSTGRRAMWEAARSDVRQVALGPGASYGSAAVLVRTSSSAHRIEVPCGLGERLVELLNARTG